MLIHFPIALFTIIGVVFDFLAQGKNHRLLAAAAYYNLLVAAIATIPVVVTGILAWRWELEGQELKGILLMHLVAGCVSTVLIWVVWFIPQESPTETRRGPARIPLADRGGSGDHRRTDGTRPVDFLSGVNGPG